MYFFNNFNHNVILLLRQVVCLFCLFVMVRSPGSCVLRSCAWYRWKALGEEGCRFYFVAFGPTVGKLLNFKVFL